MAKKSINSLIAALDIGTNKVVALIGEVKEDATIEIIGVGSQPSRGLKQGMVVNIDVTAQSIQKAIEEAEIMAGCAIHSVFTGISGSHIRSINSNGIVPIMKGDVTQGDIDRVIETAKAIVIPSDQKILHAFPQEFIVDYQGGIKEPIGMSGVRLEAKVHVISGNIAAAQNIIKCIERCGLRTSNIILQQIASGLAVLSDDEKELGVCLVDIGGGTTDIAVFTNGSVKHSSVIPIAGDQVTNDIAITFRMPVKYAERIKIDHACAWHHLLNCDKTIPLEHTDFNPNLEITKKDLSEVVEARYEELFILIKNELKKQGFIDSISAGIVLTGGASKTEGALALAEHIFQMPVRIGHPCGIIKGKEEILNNPIYSTCAGLLLYGHQNQQEGIHDITIKDGVKELLGRMKSWFKSNF